MKINKRKKRFIYLISPNKIDKNFYNNLETLFQSNLIYFFQQRFKKYTFEKNVLIGKRIKKICKKYKVKYIVNDSPTLAKKVKADGCHLGQKDIKINLARNIIKKKIIGITCHNSKKLVIRASKQKANYIALGAFYKSKTKKVRYYAKPSLLKWTKKNIKCPVVAIGGITSKNYKKLLLHKADFLAISGYFWKKNPSKAIKEFL